MLPHQLRLKKSREFKRVYSRGRSYAVPTLALHALHAKGSCDVHIGFSISKKLGGAVQRNCIKRRLRSICSQEAHNMAAGVEMVIVGRRAAATASFEELKTAVQTLFGRANLYGSDVRTSTCDEPVCS